MIATKSFYYTLRNQVIINRLSRRKTLAIVNKEQNLRRKLNKNLSEKILLKYVQDRVNLELSEILHDKNLSYLIINKQSFPKTYNLFVKGKVISNSRIVEE